MKNKILSSLVVFFSLLSFAGCKSKQSQQTADIPKEVGLAIWSNYVTPEMIQEFETKTGFKVQISNYSSNEELLAKLKAGASGIDLAVPSDYMVYAMAQMQMLQTLDQAKVEAFKDLDAKLIGKEFDPKNQYSMPLDWGTTGIAINRKLYTGSLTGWKDLFSNPKLAGKFSLLDDVRESLGAALKMNGASLNSTSNDEITKAQKSLEAIRKNVKSFTSETLMGLVEGEMAVAHAFSCDALQARAKTKGQIDFIIPSEGCTQWIDNLVIPQSARNTAGAYALMNFLLSAEISAQRTKNLWVAPSNTKAIALLPAETQKNASLFPGKTALTKCEMMKDVGESLVAFDQAWTALKASAE